MAATTTRANGICMGLQRKNVRRANRTALSCTTRRPRALFRIPSSHAATWNERGPAAVWHRTWLGFLGPELERICDDLAETHHDRAADRRRHRRCTSPGRREDARAGAPGADGSDEQRRIAARRA